MMPDKLQILLVDDEPSILKIVGKRLEIEGFKVLVATNGQDALKKAKQEAPALIILDLMLPKLNGFQVCRLLKFDQHFSHIPVILFTARTDEKDKVLGLDCKADAYVCKPFQAGELLGHIRRLLPQSAPLGRLPKDAGSGPAQ